MNHIGDGATLDPSSGRRVDQAVREPGPDPRSTPDVDRVRTWQQQATFGIEEEYFLVDPETLRPVGLADTVLGDLATEPAQPGCATHEFLASQLERSTSVYTDVQDAQVELSRFRAELASAARGRGAIAIGTGTPFDAFRSPSLTDDSRYHAITKHLRGVVCDHQISGTHVHVGVPSREAGVHALNRVRVWLPTLMAMTGNSPFWRGSDTGFDSWRAVLMRRWSTTGCPPFFDDEADYVRRTRALLGVGVTVDRASIAWYARLSENFPTVEVRIADAQLDLARTLLLAALTRGLVVTALAEWERQLAPLSVQPELLDAALWHASRDGVHGELLDPVSAELQPARVVIGELVRSVGEALEGTGDGERVADALERLWRTGTGAQQQQRAFRTRGPSGLRDLLASSFTA